MISKIFCLSTMIIVCFMTNIYLLYSFQLSKYKLKNFLMFLYNENNTIYYKYNFFLIIYTIFVVLVFKTLELSNVGYDYLYLLLLPLLLLPLYLICRKRKVKMNFTKRFVRLLTTNLIIDGILIVGYIHTLYISLNVSIIPLSICLLPIVVVLCNMILMPLEWSIKRSYISQAKRKITKMNNLIVIGVTGSAGKTTLKHLLYNVLKQKYNLAVTPKSYNTTMGVVKTINDNLMATDDILILEMGADRVGDIDKICKIVKPNISAITIINMQHLETFGDIQNIVKTKFEILDNLSDNGKCFLNVDNDLIKNHLMQHRYLQVMEVSAKNRISGLQYFDTGMKFIIDKNVNIVTKLIGKHNIMNILIAYEICKYLKVTDKEFETYIKGVEQVDNRLQIKKYNDNIILDDSYNGNIDGLKNAIDTLNNYKEYTKVIITPGLVELGKIQYQENVKLGQCIAKVCDIAYIVNNENVKAIESGINSKIKLYKKENFRDIDFSVFHKSVILICSDLPDNYF